MAVLQIQSLWAITAYFDPVGFGTGAINTACFVGDFVCRWSLRNYRPVCSLARLRRHLSAARFDPSVDISVFQNGCWRWNTSNPAMHDYVAKYFVARNEVGRIAETAAA
jgi:hypothetical protein